jgi:hypothetical protein
MLVSQHRTVRSRRPPHDQRRHRHDDVARRYFAGPDDGGIADPLSDGLFATHLRYGVMRDEGGLG